MSEGEAAPGGSAPDPAVAPRDADRERELEPERRDLLGLRESAELVRGAIRLLAQHWLPLLAIAAGSLLAHELLARLAVTAGLVGPVPGFLALALVPLVTLVALVGMLLVVRSREARRSDVWGVIAAVGSVLVPFLVVYESRGDLRADLIEYSRGTLYAQLGAETIRSGLPQIASLLVLGIVAGALLVRAVGGRLADSERLGAAEDPRRGALHVLVGYAEAVWVTLGAWVLAGVLGGLGDWWSTRTFAQGIFERWAAVRVNLPSLGAIGDWITDALPVLADAAVTGLMVPLSMLTIAVIVYGLQVVDSVSADDVVGAVKRGRWTSLTSKVGDAPLRQAWQRLSDTRGRFGALAGGLALVLRSAFAPVLVYCVLFTLLAQLDVVVWWLARQVLGWRREVVWEALYVPLDGLSQMLTLVLTVVLTAVFADRLLMRFGASGQLRTRRVQGSGNSMKVAGGKSDALTRTEEISAPSGTSTSSD